MNHSRVSPIPMRKLVIAALIFFLAGGSAIWITFAWLPRQFPFGQVPSQADSWAVVNDFHDAINSNNVDEGLDLFTDSATITDNKSVIKGRSEIRNWVLLSKRMAGLHLRMLHTEIDGEKLIWLDEAYNGSEEKNRYYILRWEAVIAEGKIQSLVVTPRYMPDLK